MVNMFGCSHLGSSILLITKMNASFLQITMFMKVKVKVFFSPQKMDEMYLLIGTRLIFPLISPGFSRDHCALFEFGFGLVQVEQLLPWGTPWEKLLMMQKNKF